MREIREQSGNCIINYSVIVINLLPTCFAHRKSKHIDDVRLAIDNELIFVGIVGKASTKVALFGLLL